MQRLFSTFADGWPGVGLLIQRVVAATLLVRFGIMELGRTSFSYSMTPQLLGAFAGILFLIGLWTPIAGTVIAVVEVWIAIHHSGDPWMPIVLAILGGTGAMIGPGAWSMDSRLFGRRHIEP